MSLIDENAKYYFYGMRLRGFAPGCQPKEGLIGCLLDEDRKAIQDIAAHYHDVLGYTRELTEKELEDYELDPLFLLDFEDLKRLKEGTKN